MKGRRQSLTILVWSKPAKNWGSYLANCFSFGSTFSSLVSSPSVTILNHSTSASGKARTLTASLATSPGPALNSPMPWISGGKMTSRLACKLKAGNIYLPNRVPWYAKANSIECYTYLSMCKHRYRSISVNGFRLRQNNTTIRILKNMYNKYDTQRFWRDSFCKILPS